MNLVDVRRELAEALQAAGVRGVYTDPPGVVTPPAVVVAPDDPYLEPRTIGPSGSSSVRVRFRLLIGVASRSTPGSLEQLEQLAVDVWRALPQGTEVGDASAPTIEQVGPSELLVSTIPVAVTATA